MLSTKASRGARHEEFVAHSASVSCLSFGLKSGRVLATGGEDKKINLWTIGKPNCILSLSGHTTSVECVKFSHNEDLICAGSQSGALKIWDLEASKILRTLTGHRAGIRSLDFHPYGDFLASGSLDTNIKLWDIRKKGCIYTYKGHSKDVFCLRFSPDGRWLASGGDEGVVKLWDLPAGKMLAEFKEHIAPITDVTFHSNEFLLSSSSSDGTVKFWDLETFQQVSTTVNDAGPISRISYHPEGKALFSAARDVLKVYQWEPARTVDTIVMGWGKVKDIAFSGTQLVAGTSSLTNVSIFTVDLKNVKPFAHDSQSAQVTTTNGFFDHKNGPHLAMAVAPMQSRRQTVSIHHQPPQQMPGATVDLKDVKPFAVHDQTTQNSTRNCLSQHKTLSAQQPQAKAPLQFLAPMQFREQRLSLQKQPQLMSRSALDLKNIKPFTLNDLSGQVSTTSGLIERKPEPHQVLAAATMQFRQQEVSVYQQPQHVPLAAVDPANVKAHDDQPVHVMTTNGLFEHKTGLPHKTGPHKALAVAPMQFHLQEMSAPNEPQQLLREAVVFPKLHHSKAPLTPDSPVELIPEARDHPAGLDMDEFLPKHLQDNMRLGYLPQPEMSESVAMVAIVRGHKSLVTALSHRRKNIQIVLAMWSSKDARLALEQAIHMDDQSVLVDILNVITLKPAVWTLDMCQLLLPCIHELLQSKYECYMSVGCGALKLILKNFAAMIKTNITAPPGVGVDISREERYNKCMSCYNHLLSVRAFILKRQTLQGKLGRSFREMSILMQNLE